MLPTAPQGQPWVVPKGLRRTGLGFQRPESQALADGLLKEEVGLQFPVSASLWPLGSRAKPSLRTSGQPMPPNFAPLALRCLREVYHRETLSSFPGAWAISAPRAFPACWPFSPHPLSFPLFEERHPALLLRNELLATGTQSDGLIIQDIRLPLVQPQMPEPPRRVHMLSRAPELWAEPRQ